MCGAFRRDVQGDFNLQLFIRSKLWRASANFKQTLCTIYLRFLLKTNFFSFICSFNSADAGVSRRRTDRHTRERRPHAKMSIQRTTLDQRIFLLLGAISWCQFWECRHRKYSIEYELQVSNYYNYRIATFGLPYTFDSKSHAFAEFVRNEHNLRLPANNIPTFL